MQGKFQGLVCLKIFPKKQRINKIIIAKPEIVIKQFCSIDSMLFWNITLKTLYTYLFYISRI